MIKYMSHLRPGRCWVAMALMVFLCAVSTPAAVSAHNGPVAEPTAVVDQLQAGLLSLSEAPDEVSFADHFEICEAFVRSTHDLAYMARLALGRRWQTLGEAEQAQFLALFTKLSVTTYVTRFQDARDISFGLPEQRELSRGLVDVRSSLIRSNGDTVSMSYVLHRTGAEFKIINIVAEGVSELILKRSQYQRILEDSDFDALAQYIEAKIIDMMAA